MIPALTLEIPTMSKVVIYAIKMTMELQALDYFCEWQNISREMKVAVLEESPDERRSIAKMSGGKISPVICYFDGDTSGYSEFSGFAAFFRFLQSNGKLR